MKLLLFTALTICIAGSKTQEIALGTNYLRAHANDSLSSQSGLNAQIIEISPGGINMVNPDQSSSSTSIIGSTVTTRASNIDDNSPENDDDDKTTKAHDHDHQSHHEHGATISIDVHNILNIFKEQLHQTEERILAAIHQQKSSSNVAIVPKSYRTAHRY